VHITCFPAENGIAVLFWLTIVRVPYHIIHLDYTCSDLLGPFHFPCTSSSLPVVQAPLIPATLCTRFFLPFSSSVFLPSRLGPLLVDGTKVQLEVLPISSLGGACLPVDPIAF
jgi:hypothetical protein